MGRSARDHGGDLDRAIQNFGTGRWLDLSTGINPVAYPVPEMEPTVWTRLPTRSEVTALETVAAQAYGAGCPVVAVAGAQAAIQLFPRLIPSGRACVVGPTYNEHAASLLAQGWRVDVVEDIEAGVGADLLVVVNPNNPDGRQWGIDTLLALADTVGLLVVDESFADGAPNQSIVSRLTGADDRILVLRSFGKFYGLAGLRLGFAITGAKTAETLRTLAGPWSVSGAAIAIGQDALRDTDWQRQTVERLTRDAARLDKLATSAGWSGIGGTDLFRTYATPDAQAAQVRLAQCKVWSRIFPYSDTWLRLGLPGSDADWAQLEQALKP